MALRFWETRKNTSIDDRLKEAARVAGERLQQTVAQKPDSPYTTLVGNPTANVPARDRAIGALRSAQKSASDIQPRAVPAPVQAVQRPNPFMGPRPDEGADRVPTRTTTRPSPLTAPSRVPDLGPRRTPDILLKPYEGPQEKVKEEKVKPPEAPKAVGWAGLGADWRTTLPPVQATPAGKLPPLPKDRPAMPGAPVVEVVQRFADGEFYLPFEATDDITLESVQGFGNNPPRYAPYGLAGHEGIDWMLPTETPLYAAAPGVVVTARFEEPDEEGKGGADSNGYGNYVVIEHADGSRTLYAHFNSIDIEEGDTVGYETRLGGSGNTGNSSGPHLHMGYMPAGGGTPGFKGFSDFDFAARPGETGPAAPMAAVPMSGQGIPAAPLTPEVEDASWQRAIDFTLGWEAGFTEWPDHLGGPTNRGIIMPTFVEWRRSQGLPEPTVKDLKNLTEEEAQAIYAQNYWEASGANELPPELALVHFDTAVISGVGRAAQFLEESGGDVEKYLDIREAFHRASPYADEAPGWFNRVDDLRTAIATPIQPMASRPGIEGMELASMGVGGGSTFDPWAIAMAAMGTGGSPGAAAAAAMQQQPPAQEPRQWAFPGQNLMSGGAGINPMNDPNYRLPQGPQPRPAPQQQPSGLPPNIAAYNAASNTPTLQSAAAAFAAVAQQGPQPRPGGLPPNIAAYNAASNAPRPMTSGKSPSVQGPQPFGGNVPVMPQQRPMQGPQPRPVSPTPHLNPYDNPANVWKDIYEQGPGRMAQGPVSWLTGGDGRPRASVEQQDEIRRRVEREIRAGRGPQYDTLTSLQAQVESQTQERIRDLEAFWQSEQFLANPDKMRAAAEWLAEGALSIPSAVRGASQAATDPNAIAAAMAIAQTGVSPLYGDFGATPPTDVLQRAITGATSRVPQWETALENYTRPLVEMQLDQMYGPLPQAVAREANTTPWVLDTPQPDYVLGILRAMREGMISGLSYRDPTKLSDDELAASFLNEPPQSVQEASAAGVAPERAEMAVAAQLYNRATAAAKSAGAVNALGVVNPNFVYNGQTYGTIKDYYGWAKGQFTGAQASRFFRGLAEAAMGGFGAGIMGLPAAAGAPQATSQLTGTAVQSLFTVISDGLWRAPILNYAWASAYPMQETPETREVLFTPEDLEAAGIPREMWTPVFRDTQLQNSVSDVFMSGIDAIKGRFNYYVLPKPPGMTGGQYQQIIEYTMSEQAARAMVLAEREREVLAGDEAGVANADKLLETVAWRQIDNPYQRIAFLQSFLAADDKAAENRKLAEDQIKIVEQYATSSYPATEAQRQLVETAMTTAALQGAYANALSELDPYQYAMRFLTTGQMVSEVVRPDPFFDWLLPVAWKALKMTPAGRRMLKAADESGLANTLAAPREVIDSYVIDTPYALDMAQIQQAQDGGAAVAVGTTPNRQPYPTQQPITSGVTLAPHPGAAAGPPPAGTPPRTVGPSAERPTLASFAPGEFVTWRSGGVDQPVRIAGIMGEQDGEIFYRIEGSSTGVPASEIIDARPVAGAPLFRLDGGAPIYAGQTVLVNPKNGPPYNARVVKARGGKVTVLTDAGNKTIPVEQIMKVAYPSEVAVGALPASGPPRGAAPIKTPAPAAAPAGPKPDPNFEEPDASTKVLESTGTNAEGEYTDISYSSDHLGVGGGISVKRLTRQDGSRRVTILYPGSDGKSYATEYDAQGRVVGRTIRSKDAMGRAAAPFGTVESEETFTPTGMAPAPAAVVPTTGQAATTPAPSTAPIPNPLTRGRGQELPVGEMLTPEQGGRVSGPWSVTDENGVTRWGPQYRTGTTPQGGPAVTATTPQAAPFPSQPVTARVRVNGKEHEVVVSRVLPDGSIVTVEASGKAGGQPTPRTYRSAEVVSLTVATPNGVTQSVGTAAAFPPPDAAATGPVGSTFGGNPVNAGDTVLFVKDNSTYVGTAIGPAGPDEMMVRVGDEVNHTLYYVKNGRPGAQVDAAKLAQDMNLASGDRSLAAKVRERPAVTAAKRSEAILPHLQSIFRLVETVDDARVVLRVLFTNPMQLRDKGILYKWTSPALRRTSENGTVPLRFGTAGLIEGSNPILLQALGSLIRMGPEEFLRGSALFDHPGQALTTFDMVALMQDLREAVYVGSAREFQLPMTSDSYKKPIPFGVDSARIKQGAPNVVEFLDEQGKVIDARAYGTSAEANRTIGLVKSALDLGPEAWGNGAVVKASGAQRNIMGYAFMGWSPSAFINNFLNPLLLSASQALTGSGFAMDPKNRFRIARPENIMAHLGQLYNGLADITERRFSSAPGQVEFMGAGTKSPSGGKLARALKEGPLRKPLRENEQDWALRFYYDGVLKFLKTYGPRARDEVIIPDLLNLGLDPEMAKSIGNAFYDAAMSNGLVSALDQVQQIVNGKRANITLSDMDPNWADYMPPDVAYAFQEIVNSSRSKVEMDLRIKQMLSDVRALKAEELLYTNAPTGRHSNHVVELTNELTEFERTASIQGIPDTVMQPARKAFVAAQQSFMKVHDGMMHLIDGTAADRNTSGWLYDSWLKTREARTGIQVRLGELAKDISMDTRPGKSARWANEYLPLSRDLWVDFYEKIAPAIYEEATNAIREGRPRPETLPRGVDFMDWASVDDAKLWDLIDRPTGTPGTDEMFNSVVDAGRSLENIAFARLFKAAAELGIPAHELFDFVVSMERDIKNSGAQVMAAQDVEMARLKALPRMTRDQFNNTWNPFRSAGWQAHYRRMWDVYQKGLRAMVEPYVAGKNVRITKRPAALDDWMRNFNTGMRGDITNPQSSQRTINAIRKRAADANIATTRQGTTIVKETKVVQTRAGRIGRANFSYRMAQGFNMTSADAETLGVLADFAMARYITALGIDSLDEGYRRWLADIRRGAPPTAGQAVPEGVLFQSEPGRPDVGTEGQRAKGIFESFKQVRPAAEVDRAWEIMQGLARAWAGRTGNPVDDYFKRLTGGGTDLLSDTEASGKFTRSGPRRGEMTLFKSAHEGTLIHEMGHLFYEDLVDAARGDPRIAQMLAVLEQKMGVRRGEWNYAHGEAFAQTFLDYVRNGKAPTPDLQAAFDAFVPTLNKYLDDKNAAWTPYSRWGSDFQGEFKDVFDSVLGEPDPYDEYMRGQPPTAAPIPPGSKRPGPPAVGKGWPYFGRRPVAPPGKNFLAVESMIRKALGADGVGLDSVGVDDSIAILQARARSWATLTKLDPDDYFKRFWGVLSTDPLPGNPMGFVEKLASGQFLVSFQKGERSLAVVFHEFAHVFHEDLREAALTHPQAARDLEILERAMGVRPKGPNEQVRIGEFLPSNWEYARGEQFAQTFVAYLNDGVAPTPELDGVFERFGQWLTDMLDVVFFRGRHEIDQNWYYGANKEKIRPVFDRIMEGYEGAPTDALAPAPESPRPELFKAIPPQERSVVEMIYNLPYRNDAEKEVATALFRARSRGWGAENAKAPGNWYERVSMVTHDTEHFRNWEKQGNVGVMGNPRTDPEFWLGFFFNDMADVGTLPRQIGVAFLSDIEQSAQKFPQALADLHNVMAIIENSINPAYAYITRNIVPPGPVSGDIPVEFRQYFGSLFMEYLRQENPVSRAAGPVHEFGIGEQVAPIFERVKKMTDDYWSSVTRDGKQAYDDGGNKVAGIDKVWRKNRNSLVPIFDRFFTGYGKPTTKRLTKDPIVLWQKDQGPSGTVYRGSTEFMEDGRAILRGLTNPDATTGLEEVSHVFRRMYADIAQADPKSAKLFADVEAHYGIENGIWKREHEERWHQDFLRYLNTDKAPTPGLAKVFREMKLWIVEMWQNLRGSRMVSPVMAKAFDDLLTPSRAAQEKYLYGTGAFPAGTEVTTPQGLGRVITREAQVPTGTPSRQTVRDQTTGQSARVSRSNITPTSPLTRQNMVVPTSGRAGILFTAPDGSEVSPGDTVYYLPGKGQKNRVHAVVTGFVPADNTVRVRRKYITKAGDDWRDETLPLSAVLDVEPTAAGGEVRGQPLGPGEVAVNRVEEVAGAPTDRHLMNALNFQLRELGLPELPKTVTRMEQVDPNLLPMLEQVMDLYVQGRPLRKAGENVIPAEMIDAYRAKLDAFDDTYRNGQQIDGDELVEQPTRGGVAAYTIEKIEQLAQKLIDDDGAMFDKTQNRAALSPDQAMAAMHSLNNSASETWNQLLLGASLHGQKMRSFGAVDFINQNRLDDFVGLFAPYHFWKTRTIKNSLERMIFEPSSFYHIYKLDKAIRGQAPDSYEEEQQQQMTEMADRAIRGTEEGNVRPPRLSGYTDTGVNDIQLPWLNGGDRGYELFFRFLPSNAWPIFEHMLWQNNNQRPGAPDQGEYATSAYDAMTGGAISFYPWINDAAEYASQRLDMGPDEQNFAFRPAEYTQQTALAAPMVALLGVDPKNWEGVAKYLMVPNTEYYIARALSNRAATREVDEITMGWAAQWLHHVRHGGPMPPEWNTIVDQEAVWKVLREASLEAASLSAVEQVSRLTTSVTLKLHDPTEDQVRADRTKFMQLFYGSYLNPQEVQNPTGSNTGAYSFMSQHPGISARSRAGELFDPTAVPAQNAISTQRFTEGDAFRTRLRTIENDASDALLSPAGAQRIPADVAVERMVASLPIYAEYLGEDVVGEWLSTKPDVLQAAYDTRELDQMVYELIDERFPSARQGSRPNVQTPYDSQMGQPLESPLETKIDERDAALGQLWNVPGRPVFEEFVNDTAQDYDGYKAARNVYEQAQLDWFVAQTGFPRDMAAKQIQEHRDRNLTEAEKILRDGYNKEQAGRDEFNAALDAERAPYQYFWDIYADLPHGAKSAFMRDPANAEFAAYYAQYAGNFWDEDPLNDPGPNQPGFPSFQKTPSNDYTLPAPWNQYLAGGQPPVPTTGQTPAVPGQAMPRATGDMTPGGVGVTPTPAKAQPDTGTEEFTTEWALWNALPKKGKEVAREFMAQHPEFALHYGSIYGNYWDDDPSNDVGLAEIPTESPDSETQPPGVSDDTWAAYLKASDADKAAMLLADQKLRAAYLKANQNGWFYWYLDSDGKYSASGKNQGSTFARTGRPNRGGYSGGYTGSGGYGAGGSGGYDWRAPDVPNTYQNMLRGNMPRTPFRAGDAGVRDESLLRDFSEEGMDTIAPNLWAQFGDLLNARQYRRG